jgi:hypothetical protein
MSTSSSRPQPSAATRRGDLVRFPLLFVLATLVPLAAAQDEPNSVTSATVSRGGLCIPSGRVKRPCDEPTTIVVRTEQETTITLALPEPRTIHCEATIKLEYTQRNTVAGVQGTIDNPDCAACKGHYTIVVRIRNEAGEVQTREFPESWVRDDEKPLEFSSEYPIGENVDLLSVRPSHVRCVCVDTPGE